MWSESSPLFLCSFVGFVPPINAKSLLLTLDRERLRLYTITASRSVYLLSFALFRLCPRMPIFHFFSVFLLSSEAPDYFSSQVVNSPRLHSLPLDIHLVSRCPCLPFTAPPSAQAHALFCVTDGSSERGDKDASKITTYPPGAVRFDCELRAVQVSCGFHHSGESRSHLTLIMWQEAIVHVPHHYFGSIFDVPVFLICQCQCHVSICNGKPVFWQWC